MWKVLAGFVIGLLVEAHFASQEKARLRNGFNLVIHKVLASWLRLKENLTTAETTILAQQKLIDEYKAAERLRAQRQERN